MGQNLQIRLGNGDDKAQNKADRYDDPQFFGSGHGRANLFAHGAHAGLCAQGKEHQTQDDHGGAHQIAQQNAGRNGSDRETQYHHDANDG